MFDKPVQFNKGKISMMTFDIDLCCQCRKIHGYHFFITEGLLLHKLEKTTDLYKVYGVYGNHTIIIHWPDSQIDTLLGLYTQPGWRITDL